MAKKTKRPGAPPPGHRRTARSRPATGTASSEPEHFKSTAVPGDDMPREAVRADAVARWSQERRAAFFAGLNERDAEALLWSWPFWARDEQRAPEGAWRTWLFMGGRGAGKTRAGAEWVRSQAEGPSPLAAGKRDRFALVGTTFAQAREVMIDGPSGLLAVAPPAFRPTFQVSRWRLEWPNGAVGHVFSAEEPDALRGPQFGAAWADEFCAWSRPEETWGMLSFALRTGAQPQAVVTTTPRPTPALKRLMEEPDCVVTRAATAANAAWLSPAFLAAMQARYAGTRLGRQELDGEIVEENPGGLWTDALLEAALDPAVPALERIVVGVDPPVSVGPNADACGIIVAGAVGEGQTRRAYVLADCTVQGATPQGWAERVAATAAAFQADRVVVEVNQGGALVRAVLAAAAPNLPVRAVHASRSKVARAEPVAALYEQGRVRHAGRFSALNAQMRAFGAPGTASPDRVDALVWALSDLMFGSGGAPRLRVM